MDFLFGGMVGEVEDGADKLEYGLSCQRRYELGQKIIKSNPTTGERTSGLRIWLHELCVAR